MSERAAVTPVLMPQAGNTMEEGTILKWLVKVGERVTSGQALFELETDKATIEVEAESDGRLARIVAPEGSTIPVLKPVAYLAESDSELDAFLAGRPAEGAAPQAPAQAASVVAAVVASAPVSGGRKKASPVARKAAEVLGVDLESIPFGSGPGGRILLEDVERVGRAPVAPGPKPVAGGERVPMSRMRRAIAKNLTVSKQTIPHWYTRVTVDAGPMLAFYKGEKALYPCTLTDVLVQACSRAIMELPAFRSKVDGDDVVTYSGVSIGLAVSVDEGLVVPVVRGVDGMNLKGIASETRRVVEAARSGKLEGIGEGVFTISNLGMFGVEEFAAIINPPESAILAVGAVREAVVVKNGAMRPGKVMTMTLSADHRLIDGSMSAKFVGRLKELLENPSALTG